MEIGDEDEPFTTEPVQDPFEVPESEPLTVPEPELEPVKRPTPAERPVPVPDRVPA